MAETGIGSDVKRREDFRFLKGVGRYTDDVTLPKQTEMYLLRSGVAHANIKNIDTSKAKGAPGVLAVYTHDDLAANGGGGVPCGWEITSRDGNKMAATQSG